MNTIESSSPKGNGSTTAVGVVAVSDIETAGAITWWRLSGSITATELLVAWEAHGLDTKLLPLPPSPESALRRAVKELEARRCLVRPLDGRDGWAVFDEVTVAEDLVTNAGDAPLRHEHVVTVRLNVAGQPSFTFPDGRHDNALTEDVTASYHRHLDQLAPGDISVWLTNLIRYVQAVALRDTGGIYFIPRNLVPTWRAISTALRQASAHVVYEVPALKSDEAVEAILSAIESEAEREAMAMEADLSDETLGERALANREARCREVETKVAAYEDLLGSGLSIMRARLDRLRANLAIRLLAEQKEAE